MFKPNLSPIIFKPNKNIIILIIATMSMIGGLTAIAAWMLDIMPLKGLIISSAFTKFCFPLCHIVIGASLFGTQINIVRGRPNKLQHSEDKYRSLIEQASDTIYILDLQGRFTDVNAAMCQMMGYTREELLQMNIVQIIDPEELRIDPLPKKMDKENTPVIRERQFIRKDGYTFTVEVNVKRFKGNQIMVIARDITYRKKMEAGLREAELKFRTIAEKSMVGVYIVQDGKFTYVNPRFARVFGYEPAEMINTFPVEEVLDESYRDIAIENIRRRIKDEIESVHYEAKGKKKDGTSNWLEFYGSRAQIEGMPTIIGSMIDITERKKTGEELKSSERQYRLLFDSNPMPMWMIAKDDQTIIAVNNAGTRLYGYTREELLNKNTRILRPEEDYGQQLEEYKSEAQNSEGERIVRHVKKDGSTIFVQIMAYDIIFEGRPVRLSMTTDITEKLKAGQDLKSAYERIQNHVNSIKDMAWKQSHLIRSPLANLQGLFTLLQDDPLNNELFAHIQNELQRMDTIIIEMAHDASDHD